MRERRGLARRSCHDNAVRAIVQQMMDHANRRLLVNASLRVKRRHHRRQHLPPYRLPHIILPFITNSNHREYRENGEHRERTEKRFTADGADKKDKR